MKEEILKNHNKESLGILEEILSEQKQRDFVINGSVFKRINNGSL